MPQPPSGAPPWAAVAAGFAALGLLHMTTGGPPVTFVLAALLLFGTLSPRRLPNSPWWMWPVRAAVYLLVLAVDSAQFANWQEFSLVGPDSNAIGYLFSAEMVVQSARSARPSGQPHAAYIVWTTLAYTLACRTVDDYYTRWLTPCYFALLLLALPHYTTTAATPVADSVRSRMPWIAAALLVGFLTAAEMGLHAAAIVRWASSRVETTAGTSMTPHMGESFAIRNTPTEVMEIDGPLDTHYLRAASFDTYDQYDDWNPSLYSRELHAAWNPNAKSSEGAPKLHISTKVHLDGTVYVALDAVGIINGAQSPLLEDDVGTFSYGADIGPSTYDLILPGRKPLPYLMKRMASPSQLRLCLAVPPSIDRRVAALARAITAGESDPVAKARSVEQYLLSNNRYSQTIEPGPGEPISNFLLRHLAGHCQFFAAAAVMLLRFSGVPARYVEGYYAHESPAANFTVVRQRDAHAWCEAWTGRAGWITVDGTPASGVPGGGKNSAPLFQRVWDKLQDIWLAAGHLIRNFGWRAVTPVVLGIAIIAAAYWQMSRTIKRKVGSVKSVTPLCYSASDAEGAVFAKCFIAFLEMKKAPCPPSRPWTEHLAVVESVDGDWMTARAFVNDYNRVRFGRADGARNWDELRPAAEELRRLTEAAEENR